MPFIYFRRHQKMLLWIIVIVIVPAFCLFGVMSLRGRGLSGVRGYVLGRKVSEREFAEAYIRWRKVTYLHGRGQFLTEQEMENNYAMGLIADMWGVQVPNKKVDERIKTIFAGIKDFNTARLRELLYNHGLTIQDYEKTIGEMLKKDTLIGHVISTVKITDNELRQLYRFENATVNIALVRFKAKDFEKEIKAEQADLRLLFEGQRPRYKIPEKFEFEYLAARTDDFEKQVKITEQEIKDYYDENKGLYKKPSSDQGGDTEKDTGAEEKPQYRPLKEVKEKIEDRLTGEKGAKAAMEAIEKIESQVVGAPEPIKIDLKSLAEGTSLKYGIIPPLSASEISTHEDLAAPPDRMQYLTRLDVGYPSIVVKGYTSLFVARLIRKHASYDPDFSEVEEQVKSDFVTEKAADRASEAAKNFAELAEEAPFDEIVEKQKLKVEKHGPLTRIEMIFAINGSSAELAQQVLNTPVGKHTRAVIGSGCAFVAKVLERGKPDWKRFDEQRGTLARRYESLRMRQAIDRWLGSLDIRFKRPKRDQDT